MKGFLLSLTAFVLGLALYGSVPAAQSAPPDTARATFEVY